MLPNQQLLIDSWQLRDDLYRELFGGYTTVSPSRYAPPQSTGERSPDVGGSSDPGSEDVRLTVLSYAPDPLRPYWTYITAGLSTPWYQDKPLEVSGFGCEMMIKTTTEANWPAQVLRTMAFYVFNHAGTLSPGVRIALNAPVSIDNASDIRNLFIWYADEAPDCWYQLPSGGFGIFAAIGITDDELCYAESIEEYGTWCIQEVLRQTGIGQVTDPSRQSIMGHTNIVTILESTKRYASNFHMSTS